VLHPGAGPDATLTYEGAKIGRLTRGHALQFTIPAGRQGRLRAGRGHGTGASQWPVFYHAIAAQPGRTIYLRMELELATVSGAAELYTTYGRLAWPTTGKTVNRGSFRVLTPAEAKPQLGSLKLTDAGTLRWP
jgi:hypothetical protein